MDPVEGLRQRRGDGTEQGSVVADGTGVVVAASSSSAAVSSPPTAALASPDLPATTSTDPVSDVATSFPREPEPANAVGDHPTTTSTGEIGGDSADDADRQEPPTLPFPSTPRHREDAGPGTFSCHICFEAAKSAVVAPCGHIFDWACIYRWLETGTSSTCPVCRAAIDREKLIPIYGHGQDDTVDPRNADVPPRPRGQRTEAPPQAQRGPFNAAFQAGGFSFGNVHVSGGVGMFPGLFGLQFHNLGGAPASDNNGQPLTAEQERRAFLSRVMFMLGVLVLVCLIFL